MGSQRNQMLIPNMGKAKGVILTALLAIDMAVSLDNRRPCAAFLTDLRVSAS